jgi:hypothetical protein
MLWRHGGTRAAKAAGVVYPLVTVIVVMGTANHYFLDAVAGAAVMGAGLLLAPLVIRRTDRIRVWFAGRAPIVAVRVPSVPAATPGAEASIVSGGCQTSTGERIPRQRESRFGPGAEPSASPSDAGDGAPAAAR